MEFKPYLNFQAQKSHATKSQYGFRNNSICLTKIPKNACTSLLNAFIRLEGKTNVWFEMGTRIHEVAQRWCVEQSELVFFDPRISVIVFRDPALRLYSSFIDKLVNHDLSHGNFDAFFLRALGKTLENLRISEVVNASNSIPAFLLKEPLKNSHDRT